jgi:F0F1-type ATP synthase epsilon subunit
MKQKSYALDGGFLTVGGEALKVLVVVTEYECEFDGDNIATGVRRL